MKYRKWKDVPGYEGLYQVSNFGEVRSLFYRGRKKIQLLKPAQDKKGYLHVNLYKDKKAHMAQIHRLVAMAFIPNPNNFPVVNHIDWNTQNNRVDNLEWCTVSYNNQHRPNNDMHEKALIRERYIREHNIREKVAQANYIEKLSLSATDNQITD